jgi:hypothetical protein
VAIANDHSAGPESLWADLEKDELAANRALLTLADRPVEATALLKSKMKPLTITRERVHSLLKDLGREDEKVWRRAFEELDYFDPRLVIDLETLMRDITEPLVRTRMVELMSARPPDLLKGKVVGLMPLGRGKDFQGFNFVMRPGGAWWAEHRVENLNMFGDDTTKTKWTRTVRGVVLLEHIGTLEALAIVKEISTGDPDAQPTKVALEAVARSARKHAANAMALPTWWADLEKTELEAAQVLLNFADRPAESVAFLKKQMRPLTIDGERVQTLLTDLGSEDDAIWKPAFEELQYFDPRLVFDLQSLMRDVKEPSVRTRMVEIMSGFEADSHKGKEISLRGNPGSFNFFDGQGSWHAEDRVERMNVFLRGSNEKKKWTRAVRAMVFLEHTATPDAVSILKVMASGQPDAQPTKAAREAMGRLKKEVR